MRSGMVFQPPRVSIVIPLYDKADVLMETLTCVQRQTVRDFEVIVIDDGSTDGGGALVEAVADPRFRLLRQENLGVSAARNRGILEAQTEWVAFLDADDIWLGTHLADLLSAVEDPEVIGAFTNYIFESRGLPAVACVVPSQRVDDYFSFALAKWWLSDAYQRGTFQARTANRLRLVRRWQVDGRRYRHVVSPCLSWVIPIHGASIGDISRRAGFQRRRPQPQKRSSVSGVRSAVARYDFCWRSTGSLGPKRATVCKLLAAGACAAASRPRRAFSSPRGTAAAVHASMGSHDT